MRSRFVRPAKAALRFVRAVLVADAVPVDGMFRTADGASLAADAVRQLQAEGVLGGDATRCCANAETRTWLKRAMLDDTAFAAQHRTEVPAPDGARLNLDESPLARLATGLDGQAPYLERHQVEAGERLRRLCERAQLQPRVTMSYSATHIASKGVSKSAEMTDMAAAARRELAALHNVLPADCAGVVLDVCGLLKGLQVVEAERGWPRRSAKLVLRIGLEQLAQHFGLAPLAVGTATRKPQVWGERPTLVG